MLSQTAINVIRDALVEYEYNHHAAGLPGVIEARQGLAELEQGEAWEVVPNWEPVYCDCDCMSMIENHPNGIQTTRDDGRRTGIQLDPESVRLCRRTRTASAEQEGVLEALKLAYRKHHLGDDSIGWSELSDTMLNALCEAMGDKKYLEWSAQYESEER